MFVRRDSSELAVTTMSFGDSSSSVEHLAVSWALILLPGKMVFFDGMSAPLIEEVSLIREVRLVENSLLEVLLADEKPSRWETLLRKLSL